MGYCQRAIQTSRANNATYHSDECLAAGVDAYCDDRPEPGCICRGRYEIALEYDRQLSVVQAAPFGGRRARALERLEALVRELHRAERRAGVPLGSTRDDEDA